MTADTMTRKNTNITATMTTSITNTTFPIENATTFTDALKR